MELAVGRIVKEELTTLMVKKELKEEAVVRYPRYVPFMSFFFFNLFSHMFNSVLILSF